MPNFVLGRLRSRFATFSHRLTALTGLIPTVLVIGLLITFRHNEPIPPKPPKPRFDHDSSRKKKLGLESGKLSRGEETAHAWCSSFLPALLLATMLAASSGSWWIVVALACVYVACLVAMLYFGSKSADQSGEDSTGQNPINRTGWGVGLALALAGVGAPISLFLPSNSLPNIVATLIIAAASAGVSATFFTLHPHSRK